MSNELNLGVGRFLDWLTTEAAPLWSTNALDPKGGFYEALHQDGSPAKHLNKRVRVQSRQAFSFARMDRLGLGSGFRAVSDHAYEFLWKNCLRDRSFVHIVSASGEIVDPKVDTYDLAFALMAATERFLAYNDQESLKHIEIIRQMLNDLKHADKGYTEGFPPALPRRANPHMHLFEAFTLLREALPTDSSVQIELDNIRSFFWDTFYDNETSTVREFFTDDFQVDETKGAIVEPGHMAEWAWLLFDEHKAGAQTKDITSLVIKAEEFGAEHKYDFLSNTFDTSSGQRSQGKRMWPQTERIRALTIPSLAPHDGVRKCADNLIRFQDQYLNTPIPGGWYDELSADGSVLSEFMPSSSMYHIMTLATALLPLQQTD